MRHLYVSASVLAFILSASAAPAADPSAPLVCALVDVYDCSTGNDCIEVESEVVGVPDVLRLDPAAKSMTALDTEFAGASGGLDSVSSENGRTVARAREGDRSLVLSVESASGDAILVVNDSKLALMAYGECAAP